MQQTKHLDYQQELDRQTERTLFLQAPVSNSTVITIALIFYLVLYPRLDSFYLFPWVSSMVILACLRILLWLFHKKQPDRFSSAKWIKLYTLASALLGVSWGSCYLLGYGNTDQIVSFALFMLLFGVLSAAVSILFCYLPAFIAYTYPQVIVSSGILFSYQSTTYTFLGITVILYLIMLTLFARNFNKQFVKTTHLQYENSYLINGLNREVEQREHLVQQRTSELLNSNEELEKEVSERIKAQQEAGFQIVLLNSVLNSTPDLIFYKDYQQQDGCYIGCNAAYAKLTGMEESEILGKNDVQLFGEDEGKYLRAKDQVVLQSRATHRYEEWVTYPDGSHILLSTLRTPFYAQDKTLLGILGVGRDITDMKNTEQQLKRNELTLSHLAHHDTLTELPNRLLLIDRLEQSIKKAERANEGLAIMFIDLDHFKEINDSLGHSIGDQLLQAVAKRLTATIRSEDTAARLGGDEFTIILEQLEDRKFVTTLAKKLLLAFKKPLILRDREITITLSIGISLYPEHGEDTESLLRNADSAMYRTKNEGRNGYSLYTEDLTQRAVERVVLESALRKAIDNHELELYFQPQIDLGSDEIVGSEALLRWNSADQGLLLPNRFIPLAEEIGLINEIGLWVFQTCCEKIVEWQASGLNRLKIAINLSGRQLLDDNFADKVRAIIKQTACPPELIELEITEGYLIKHPEKTVFQFNKLREIGIQISIDDFGTGYSSLTYLKQFPISKLKIDYSFIRDILVDPNDQAITRAIIALGKSLDLKVIAEGVENERQKDFVINEGCDEAQGYYFSRPMPESQFLDYMRKMKSKIADE